MGKGLPSRYKTLFFIILAIVLGAAVMIASATGPVPVSPVNVVLILLAKVGLGMTEGGPGELEEAVVISIRLPRIIMAILVGGSLSMSGAALQGLFRNPLADPSLIGISGGAAVGAVAAITVLPVSAGGMIGVGWLVPALAMGSGLLATVVIYRLARVDGRTLVSSLLLAGLAVNTLAAALVGLCLYLASVNERSEFLFWMLGSLYRSNWEALMLSSPFMLAGLIFLPVYSRSLNALMLGEADAFHLGFNPESVRRWLVVLSAASVGAGVAVCGIIGFVGLIVPHLVRLMIGPDHRTLLPASALAGAALLVIADLSARTLAQPSELPIGILTALVGAPFFLILLQQRKFGEALS